MNSGIIMKNHVADPEITFLTKSISKPFVRETVMPPTWELRKNVIRWSRRLAKGRVLIYS